MRARYSVWVGGNEVNEYLLTRRQAKDVKQIWEKLGYDDVAIGRYSNREITKWDK